MITASGGSWIAAAPTGGGGGGGAVNSVFTRIGDVVAVAGDYNAGQITYTPHGTVAAVTVQAAIDELADETAASLSTINSSLSALSSGKQAADADLDALAGQAGNGIYVKTGAGTGATRTLGAGTGLTWTNGDGVAGAPSIAITDAELLALRDMAGTGYVSKTGAGAFANRSIVAGANISVTNGDGVSGDTTIAVTGISAGQPSRFAYNLCQRNAGFEIWQREPPLTAQSLAFGTTVQVADGWYVSNLQASGNPCQWQRTTTTAPSNAGGNGILIGRNNGVTSTPNIRLGMPFDQQECRLLASAPTKILCLSFLLRLGGGVVASKGNFGAYVAYGTGSTPQKRGAGFTNEVVLIDQTVDLAALIAAGGGPVRISMYAAAPFAPANSNHRQGEIGFYFTGIGSTTASNAEAFHVDDVMLEFVDDNTVPGVFVPIHPVQDLLRCQRFYYKTFPVGVAPAQNVGASEGTLGMRQAAGAAAANGIAFEMRWPTPMYAAPTVVTYNPFATNAQPRNNTVNADCSAVATSNVSTEALRLTATTAAGSAATNLNLIHVTADCTI